MRRVSGPAGELLVNPERGAKITSLRSAAGLEWLTTTPARVVERGGQFGFTEAEMCGWDECAPTINPGVLLDGRRLADHGDVWDRPWQVQHASESELTTTVAVDPLGFWLTRAISATPTGFRLDYRAQATGPADLPFLWAAHPQFAITDDLRLELPGWGIVRQVYPQPEVTSSPQQRPGLLAAGDLPLVTGAHPSRALKVCAPAGELPNVPVRAELVREHGRLSMSWGGEPIRGVALWFDPAEIGSSQVVAIEPATGTRDDASAAEPGREVAELVAGEPLQWWVDLVLTD